MANPDPEITPEDGSSGARRRHHGHRPLRLSQPGQQRARLPLHLPRRPGRARHAAINEEMKMAAVHALAKLAREEVPESVCRAYGDVKFSSAANTSFPSRSIPRALLRVAPAVAKAAMDSGVARQPIEDMAKYMEHLEALQGKAKETMRHDHQQGQGRPQTDCLPRRGATRRSSAPPRS